MLTIGLTGNVASGKTTVADRWRERGVLVIDADRVGHEVLREDRVARSALVEAFGNGILDPEGAIDRTAVRVRIGTIKTGKPVDTTWSGHLVSAITCFGKPRALPTR